MEGRPTLEELERCLQAVLNWRQLGSKLNISDTSLSKIENQFTEVRDRRREMFRVWLEENFMNASRNAMADALHAIDEHTVADEYTRDVQDLPPHQTAQQQLDMGPQPLRERSFQYTKAIEESQVHTGRSTFVSVVNKPKISVKTNVKGNLKKVDKHLRNLRNLILLLIIVSLVFCFLLYYWRSKINYTMETETNSENAVNSNQNKDAIKRLTPISIENSETVIASKLTEVTNMFELASCLNIKNSKATVEQFVKNHRGQVDYVRIEVIDVWLKSAEQRYWEDLIVSVRTCLHNERLAHTLSQEYIK